MTIIRIFCVNYEFRFMKFIPEVNDFLLIRSTDENQKSKQGRGILWGTKQEFDLEIITLLFFEEIPYSFYSVLCT